MRCFIAVPVAEPVRKLILEVQRELRRAEADVNWVAESNLHLTLKFLGDISEAQAASLRDLCSGEAARWPGISLQYAGMGSFPERGTPRVVWAGCTGDIEKLAGLAAAIECHAETVGVPREGRPFVAHLTIGRVRSSRNVKRLQAAIENQRRVPLGNEEVREFTLFRSTLTPQGPVYDALAAFTLGTPR
jgi:2'-5' RNA ligase